MTVLLDDSANTLLLRAGGGAAAECSLCDRAPHLLQQCGQDDVNTQTPAVRHATASCAGAAALAGPVQDIEQRAGEGRCTPAGG